MRFFTALSAARGLVCVLALFAITGCGAVQQARQAANRQKDANNLRMVGIMIHNMHDINQKGPANWDELIAFANQQGAGPMVTELRDRGYVVTAWDIKFRDVSMGMSNFVLMYEPAATTSGGSVLYLDGSVRTMPAGELNTALAAQAGGQ